MRSPEFERRNLTRELLAWSIHHRDSDVELAELTYSTEQILGLNLASLPADLEQRRQKLLQILEG